MWHWWVRDRHPKGRVVAYGMAETREEATNQAADAAFSRRYHAGSGKTVMKVYERKDPPSPAPEVRAPYAD